MHLENTGIDVERIQIPVNIQINVFVHSRENNLTGVDTPF